MSITLYDSVSDPPDEFNMPPEEKIAIMYDHLQKNAAIAYAIINDPATSEDFRKELFSIVDGWLYVDQVLFPHEKPKRSEV